MSYEFWLGLEVGLENCVTCGRPNGLDIGICFFLWNGCYLVTGQLAMICNDGMMECSPGCVLHVFFYCDRYICVNINIYIYICLLYMENDWADDLKSCNYMVMIYRMIYRSTNLSIDLSIYLPQNIVYSSLV